MNIEKIVEGYTEFDNSPLPRLPFVEKRVGETAEIIEALDGLQKNESYRKLRKLLLDSQLSDLLNRMRREQEPIEIYRLQGRITELDKFVNLDKLQAIFKNSLLFLKNQQEKLKNAEKKEN